MRQGHTRSFATEGIGKCRNVSDPGDGGGNQRSGVALRYYLSKSIQPD